MRQARPQGPPWCAQGSPAVWHSSPPCMAAPHWAASASAPCLSQKKRKGGILVLDARCDMHLIAAVSSNTHMSKRSACCTLARLAFAACPISHVILVLLDLSRTYLAHHELESVAIIIVIIIITCSCFHATLHISLLYHQKPLKFKTTVQYVKSKESCLSAFRLLEEAGSSLTGFIQHPDSASLTSSGHTRVLRVAPVSSHFGPPSFPATSASLDLPDNHVVPISQQPLSTAPGGLSRSLSASASSGGQMPNGQMPNGISTHGASQAGQQQLSMHCV